MIWKIRYYEDLISPPNWVTESTKMQSKCVCMKNWQAGSKIILKCKEPNNQNNPKEQKWSCNNSDNVPLAQGWAHRPTKQGVGAQWTAPDWWQRGHRAMSQYLALGQPSSHGGGGGGSILPPPYTTGKTQLQMELRLPLGNGSSSARAGFTLGWAAGAWGWGQEVYSPGPSPPAVGCPLKEALPTGLCPASWGRSFLPDSFKDQGASRAPGHPQGRIRHHFCICFHMFVKHPLIKSVK